MSNPCDRIFQTLHCRLLHKEAESWSFAVTVESFNTNFQKKKARLCMTMATPVLHPEQKLGLVGNSAPTATHKHMKEHGQIGLLYLLV